MGQYVKAFSRETEAGHSVLGASDRRSICLLQHFHGSNIIEFVSATWETFFEKVRRAALSVLRSVSASIGRLTSRRKREVRITANSMVQWLVFCG